MRSTCLVALVAVVVLAGTRFSVGVASSKPAKPRPPQVRAERTAEADVVADGFGRNASDARETALEHAKEKVRDLLRKRFDSPDWDLPASRLDTDLLARS